jgi:hypothetical protein
MPEIGVDDPAENRRRLRIRIMRIFLCTLGPNHPKCQAFIKAEDKRVRKHNDAARRLNEHSKQYLMRYKRNRYTGHMPLSTHPS